MYYLKTNILILNKVSTAKLCAKHNCVMTLSHKKTKVLKLILKRWKKVHREKFSSDDKTVLFCAYLLTA